MPKFVLKLCIILLFFSCENAKKENTAQIKAKVYFFIEDSLIGIKSKFSIDIYCRDVIIKSKINNDSAFWKLSLSDSSEIIRIVFKWSNYQVDINEIPAYVLMPKYKIDLIFGIDHIPFRDEVLFPIKDSNSYKNITDIYYIKTDPIEQGLGRIFKSYK